ncbi:unnamed protein product [Cylindrotheca closterium]|uniref:Uncharacterized protein n=1 Tax=Cylindrotheca closterium TaxID=2856 RepID=A0AAD2FK22_9STRA|nr:unnamed protein product [Cylindrotheca closterium]CAJ1951248.1 unnamed protein product [Cylindrotheca closterium]
MVVHVFLLEDFRLLMHNYLENSTYGGTCIPPGGLPIADAQLFGKYVYLLMSLFGSQEDATMDQIYGGDYEDSVFRASLFGQNLLHLCKLPQHTAIVRLWRCRPRQCTLQWMEDLCALFGEVTAMILWLALLWWLQLWWAAMNSPKPLCYLDKFQLLYERVERKWDPAELDVNGHTWSHSFSSSFFGTAIPPVLPPRGPDSFRHGLSDGVQTPLAKRQRLELPPAGPPPGPPRPEHTVPFTAKKPLFKSLLPVEAGQSVYEAVLMKKLVRGDSPLLLNPQGMLKHPICFRAAFEGSCLCNNGTGICQSRGFAKSKGVGRDCLHVDLADPRWHAPAYAEANWAPVVKFVKLYQEKGVLGPSDWFKALTPSAQWAP